MAVLHLSADEVARLNAAHEALLSPLASGSTDEWRLCANRAVRELLGADHSVYAVGTDAGPAMVTEDTDPTFLDLLLQYFVGVENGDHRYRDRWMDNGVRRRRANGPGAYHDYMLSSADEIRHSPVRQDIFAPVGLTYLAGLSTPMPVGEASIFLSFTGSDGDARSQAAHPMLELLVPAFDAGVRVQRQLSGRRAALASMFDRMGDALAIYSTGGVASHLNRALIELLVAEPGADLVRESADALARALALRWNGRRGIGDGVEPPEAAQYVTTSAAEYRLLGSYLPAELFGAEGVLVQVECLRPQFPSGAALRSRFALTQREAEVALLLAEGLTDGAIAERLSMSAHTARRHSERVLRKLGLHSRAAVAFTLLRP